MAREVVPQTGLLEFEGLDLGDDRRTVRGLRIVEALERNPAAGFPTAVAGVAEREAVYRFLNNPRISMDSLLAPHAAHTIERASASGERPLVVIDPTEFIFGGETDRHGLERLGKSRQGFKAFVALAVTHARRPLGVLTIRPVEGRGRIDADGWADVISTTDEIAQSTRPIYVMDREADAYALFAEAKAHGNDFVIRVAHDRWVKEHDGAADEMLRDIAARAPVTLTRDVKLARRSTVGTMPQGRRRHPPRDGRDAVLTVRASAITLPRPKTLRDEPKSLVINLVQVIEEAPPAGVPGVEWLLFTTLPIDTPTDVAYVVDSYRARWTIEEYFKCLKTGCRYESRELESRDALLNALGLLAPLAWRLLALKCAADNDAATVGQLLDDVELQVLRKISVDVKIGAAPTARDVLLAIAILGGHFKQNGRPGWQVIWRGFQKVCGLAEGYRLARGEM